MKKLLFCRWAVLLIALIGVTITSHADTIQLKDGSVINGVFAGGDHSTIRFDVGGRNFEFPVSQVAAIKFSASAAASPAQAPPPRARPSVPAGTAVKVRLDSTLDSRMHHTGHQFTARLEGDLMAGGVVVAPRGSQVYGRLVSASSSRNMVGRSEMTIELTDIMVHNQVCPIATSNVQAVTEETGKKTLRRTARAAAVGGLIGGSDGARTGAKVGAGASLLTQGNQIYVPAGTLLNFQLRAALTP